MKMLMTTTFVSLLAVGGVAYASRRRRAKMARISAPYSARNDEG